MIRLEDIPKDENGAVLRQMRADGDSLTLPRPIDFSVVFPSEQAALAFCEAIRECGLKLVHEDNRIREDRPWDVTVTREMVPNHAELGAMEALLKKHAEPLGGINDGWGCFNMDDLPKVSPREST